MSEDDPSAPEWSEENCRAYARYMERNVRHDHRKVARRIRADWAEVPVGATVVDVAAGPGYLLFELASLLERPRLVLTDASSTMIELARAGAAARGLTIAEHVCPADALDLVDASADLLVCKHSLRLVPDVDAVLREMARVVRRGGRAYLADFNAERPPVRAWLLRRWIQLTAPAFIRGHFAESMARGLSAASLPARLLAAGFEDAGVVHGGVSFLVRAVR